MRVLLVCVSRPFTGSMINYTKASYLFADADCNPQRQDYVCLVLRIKDCTVVGDTGYVKGCAPSLSMKLYTTSELTLMHHKNISAGRLTEMRCAQAVC
jgi:hypothetical protein